MDVMMPNMDGVDACREIMELLPDTRVLMLTASTTEDAVVDAIAAGATGYLQKDSGPEELAEAIREVAQGRLRIPDKSIRRVFAMIRGQRALTASRVLKALTDREREILQMFASGKSYAQIAEVKGNKIVTVRNSIYRIQDKLGVDTKQEMVVWAVKNGLLRTWSGVVEAAHGGRRRTVRRGWASPDNPALAERGLRNRRGHPRDQDVGTGCRMEGPCRQSAEQDEQQVRRRPSKTHPFAQPGGFL